jgi:hypothetical protein
LGWPQRGPLQVFSFYRGNIWSLDGVGYTSPQYVRPPPPLALLISASLFLPAILIICRENPMINTSLGKNKAKVSTAPLIVI